MIKLDEEALICDLAEIYNIYEYKELSTLKVASFAVGLRSDSRIKMKISDVDMPLNIMLLVRIIEQLNLLIWSKTKDGAKGKNRPKSILKHMQKKDKNIRSFTTGKDFEKERKKIQRKED